MFAGQIVGHQQVEGAVGRGRDAIDDVAEFGVVPVGGAQRQVLGCPGIDVGNQFQSETVDYGSAPGMLASYAMQPDQIPRPSADMSADLFSAQRAQ